MASGEVPKVLWLRSQLVKETPLVLSSKVGNLDHHHCFPHYHVSKMHGIIARCPTPMIYIPSNALYLGTLNWKDALNNPKGLFVIVS